MVKICLNSQSIASRVVPHRLLNSSGGSQNPWTGIPTGPFHFWNRVSGVGIVGLELVVISFVIQTAEVYLGLSSLCPGLQ
jgi:hypothetical protein